MTVVLSSVPSRIEEVTVYRCGAEVQRVADMEIASSAAARARLLVRLPGLPLCMHDASVQVHPVAYQASDGESDDSGGRASQARVLPKVREVRVVVMGGRPGSGQSKFLANGSNGKAVSSAASGAAGGPMADPMASAIVDAAIVDAAVANAAVANAAVVNAAVVTAVADGAIVATEIIDGESLLSEAGAGADVALRTGTQTATQAGRGQEPRPPAVRELKRLERRIRLAQRALERLERLEPVSTEGGARASGLRARTQARLRLLRFRREREIALRRQLLQLESSYRQLRARVRDGGDTVSGAPADVSAAATEDAGGAHGGLCKGLEILLVGGSMPRYRLMVRYLVPGARWAPSYALHLGGDGHRVDDASGTLTMRAVVAQKTGEDWRGVRLHLRTEELPSIGPGPGQHSRWWQERWARSGRERGGTSGEHGSWCMPSPGATALYEDYDDYMERRRQRREAADAAAGETAREAVGGTAGKHSRVAAANRGGRPPQGRNLRGANHEASRAMGGAMDGDSLRNGAGYSEGGDSRKTARDIGKRSFSTTHPDAFADIRANWVNDRSPTLGEEEEEGDEDFSTDDDTTIVDHDRPLAEFANRSSSSTQRMMVPPPARTGEYRARTVAAAVGGQHEARAESAAVDGGSGRKLALRALADEMEQAQPARPFGRAKSPSASARASSAKVRPAATRAKRPNRQPDRQPDRRQERGGVDKAAIATLTAGTPVVPAEELLDYAELRMDGPDLRGRGRLRLAAPDERYRSAARLASIDPTEVTHLIKAAHVHAESVIRMSLPQRYRTLRPTTSDQHYTGETSVDVPSDSGFCPVPVASHTVEARIRHVLVPRQDTSVHRVARIGLPNNFSMLSGVVDLFWQGTLLQSREIGVLPSGMTLELVLGIESGIEAHRSTEFHEKSVGLIRGGRRLCHRVTIEVHNHLDHRVSCEIRERIPMARAQDSDISIHVVEVKPLWERDDNLGRRGATVAGGHCWRLSLAAGAKRSCELRYEIRLPSRRELVGGDRRD